MDGHQFDLLAKAIAIGSSRRGFLKALFAGSFAGALGLSNAAPSVTEFTALAASTSQFKFPWAGSKKLRFTGGPHRWGGVWPPSGIDFASGSSSTHILAMADGKVVWVGDEACDGACKTVKVLHTNGWEVWYIHLSAYSPLIDGLPKNRPLTSTEQLSLVQGQWLGNEGSTGAGTRVHIHLELRKDGKRRYWRDVPEGIEGWVFDETCSDYVRTKAAFDETLCCTAAQPRSECTAGTTKCSLGHRRLTGQCQSVIKNDSNFDYNGYMRREDVHALPEKEAPQYQVASTNQEIQGISSPKIMSGPTVSGITDTAAKVSWTTNVPNTTSWVRYGKTTNYDKTSAKIDVTTTKPSIPLSGLAQNTTYYYRVYSSVNNSSPVSKAGSSPFKTKPAVAPKITSGPTFSNKQPTSVTLKWTTDKETTGLVKYGLTTNYGASKSDPPNSGRAESHTVILKPLTPGKKYYYSLQSKTAAGKQIVKTGSFTAPSCPSGTSFCGGACVDTEADPQNCGKCGTSCPSGFCLNKKCCPAGTNGICSTSGTALCVNTRTQVDNCGSCGNVCPAGHHCIDSECISVGCSGDTTDCDGSCANLRTDENNCGSCGRECDVSEICCAGECRSSELYTPECCVSGPGRSHHWGRACSGICVDIEFDSENCSECGRQCHDGANCVYGDCQCPSGSGETYCYGTETCTNLLTDPANCGGCGLECSPDRFCCPAYWGFCGDPSIQTQDCCGRYQRICNGVCVDMERDNDNCGECGRRCRDGASCVYGECQCSQGGLVNYCYESEICADWSSDPANCYGCGRSCDSGFCLNGQCCPDGSTGVCSSGGQAYCC